MINTILDKVKLLYKRIQLSRINFLNHRFKKYIVKYEIEGNNIKIYNSCGNSKIVKNNIANKVKVMEIIKDHEKEINKKIKYYDDNSNDYLIIYMSSALLLIVLGFTFVFSFFVGSYVLFILSFISFSTVLVLFCMNGYKTLILREEVKRLKNIKNNNIILEDNELLEIITDSIVYLKKYFYDLVLKIIGLFDKVKVKFN